MLTNHSLLTAIRDTGRPIILSTGMSTLDEIEAAVNLLGKERLVLMHSVSEYPCPVEHLNLACIDSLRRNYGVPVGYSGHETGVGTTTAAVAMGAVCVERHITLDRAMWGTDQAASLEPQGLKTLVRDIRALEQARGDGIKRVTEGEQKAKEKLRA